jgi:hypothetical protein
MEFACCFLGFYLYLQIAVIFNSWKLLKWHDPKWAWTRRDDKPESLRDFCRYWLFITPSAMFIDVGIILTFSRMMTDGEWIRFINYLPWIMILAGLTYTKTQFIHMCWLALQAERLKKRDKKN